ncbi:AzlD domain-containing protein [Parachitinimonas caeni]|uniref:AzlD domain-containing protein n=1 Tax=Parachitinimonas caeni TaxID=3031301 RepID=A0ABT7DZW8_9NEIS|nr:AzlD domain-containing protein [Parachitinimonas caeni]MDK2125611.1 AzlD domain-containing protein [Parachitinimonas caeni]
MTEFLTIVGMAVLTFAIRYLPYAFGGRLVFPPALQAALRYVPVAVLTAIIVPTVLLPDGSHWQLSWRNPAIIGSLASALIVWRTRHLLAAIGGGMLIYFGWRWLFLV